ncbi:MAG: HEAT repeat domain-containing protein [Ardenticatenaceae bacterium]|nr:HEAT repeat domain-containing protein [Ardenticatenaceae bacterium]
MVRLQRWWKIVTARLRTGVEQRFYTETIGFVQGYHLGRHLVALEKIYTPPRFLAPLPVDDPEHLLPASAQFNYIWPELATAVATPLVPEMTLRQLLRNGRRILITGTAGSGKTTLLAYITYLCAAATPAEPDDYLLLTLPAMLHLAELNLATEETDPLAPIITALRQRSSPLARPGIPDLLRQKLKADNLLLLLDGWDELADGMETAVFTWLHNLFTTHPNLRAIITTSPTGYGPLLSFGFTQTIIRPWDINELETFAEQWAKPLENNPLSPERYWLPGRSAHETSLRFWLLMQGHTASTAHNPQRIYDLFTLYLKHAIAQTDETAPQASMEPFWQSMAYTLLSSGKLSLTANELTALATETLQYNMAQTDVNEVKALQKATLQHPFFVQDSNGSVRFLSKTWRDFLAAGYLVQQELTDVPASHVREEAWANVLRFYVAQVGAAALVKPLLHSQVSSPMRDGLFQAASWLPEAADSDKWRQQTLILLGQMTRQRTFAQVLRLRAAVALAQTAQPGTMTFVQQLLERSDRFLRQMGVVALSHLGWAEPEQVVEMLQNTLADGDGLVRETAVTALSWLATPLAETALLSALIEGDDNMRRVTAASLVHRGDFGRDILKEALEDEDVRVRRAAIYGLTRADDVWAEPLLAQVERQDSEWLVRTAATEALEMIRTRRKPSPWEPLQPRQLRWLSAYATMEGRVVPIGEATLPFVVQVMAQATKPSVRAAAAMVLGQLLDEQTIPALETAVQDPDTQVQNTAFAILCLVRRAFK